MVLYEDPPDQVPKIHVRSSKYMAWIAENQLPVHMHAEKGKALQFDQWRIAHLAEFGLCNFAEVSTSRAPTPAQPASPTSPKAKRRRKKDRKSKPEPEPEPKPEAKPEPEPEPAPEPEVTEEAVNEPSPVPSPEQGRSRLLECGHCGEVFTVLRDLTEHALYRCLPDQAFDCDRECFEFFRPAPSAGKTKPGESVTNSGSNKVNIMGEAESPSAENDLSKTRRKSGPVVTKETGDADQNAKSTSVKSNSAKSTKGESDILSSETLATTKTTSDTEDAAAEIIRAGQSEEDKTRAGSGKEEADKSETCEEATEAVQTGGPQASPADPGADISDTEADKENERGDTGDMSAQSSTRQRCQVSHD